MREIFVMFVMLATLAMASSAANARDHQQFGTSKKTTTSTTAPATTKPRPPRICSDFGSTTTCYGNRYNVRMPNGTVLKWHRGIDFKGKKGRVVISSTHGEVRVVTPNRCGDNRVTVKPNFDAFHPRFGKTFVYVHYTHIVPTVSVFDVVKPGDPIGYIDDKKTRCSSTITHVHFEVDVRGQREGALDPNDFWADGPGQVTCYEEGVEYPDDKFVAPLLCD